MLNPTKRSFLSGPRPSIGVVRRIARTVRQLSPIPVASGVRRTVWGRRRRPPQTAPFSPSSPATRIYSPHLAHSTALVRQRAPGAYSDDDTVITRRRAGTVCRRPGPSRGVGDTGEIHTVVLGGIRPHSWKWRWCTKPHPFRHTAPRRPDRIAPARHPRRREENPGAGHVARRGRGGALPSREGRRSAG